MNSRQSHTSVPEEPEEETPIQRAQRILSESIAFRTTVVEQIHKDIHKVCWDGWLMYRNQRDMCKSRTRESTLCGAANTRMEMGRGSSRWGTTPGAH